MDYVYATVYLAAKAARSVMPGIACMGALQIHLDIVSGAYPWADHVVIAPLLIGGLVWAILNLGVKMMEDR